MSTYEEFAKIYDKLMYDVDYSKWYDYIHEILIKYQASPRKVLEMACGTGNFTKYMCEDGYEVTCFDASDDMLSVAFNKLAYYNNLTILNQNMIDFDLNSKFDLILAICDSVNYVTEYDDLIKVFSNVYNHLEDDGIFVFDINSKYKLKEIIGSNTFVEDNEDIFYVWENEYDESSDICAFFITFFIKNDKVYSRFDEEHYERAYTVDEIINALKNAQFSKVEVHDDFSFNKVKNESERIVFIVKK